MDDATSYQENNCYATQTTMPWREHNNGHYATEPGMHWREHPSERLNAMRRSLGRALHASGHANCHLRPQPKLETLINSIVCSLTKESILFLTGPGGEAALACLVSLLAHATSRFVVTDEAKLAIRVSAQEVTTGLMDALHRSLQAHAMKVPRLVLCFGVVVVGAYGALLAVGLLLCLWRFTLFGLTQEKSLRCTTHIMLAFLHSLLFPAHPIQARPCGSFVQSWDSWPTMSLLVWNWLNLARSMEFCPYCTLMYLVQ